jgi:antitoxin (DNA-binding transcriptional repressor) of toxin-antitoxin stability system
MSTVSLKELQQDPDALSDRVEAGEHLVIVRNGHPVAEFRPLPAIQTGPRPFGLCAGEFTVPDDFDAPLPDEILRGARGVMRLLLTYGSAPVLRRLISATRSSSSSPEYISLRSSV